jgi:hypothetical protein
VKIKTLPIVYYIWTAHYPSTVIGEAIQLPDPWSDIRLCVRQIMPWEPFKQPGCWQIDHYPTGLSVQSFVAHANTRDAALMRLEASLGAATPRELRVLRATTADEVVRALRVGQP